MTIYGQERLQPLSERLARQERMLAHALALIDELTRRLVSLECDCEDHERDFVTWG